jgi:hypothetical protein
VYITFRDLSLRPSVYGLKLTALAYVVLILQIGAKVTDLSLWFNFADLSLWFVDGPEPMFYHYIPELSAQELATVGELV